MAGKADKPVINPDEAPEEQGVTAQTEEGVEQKEESSTKSTAKAGKRSKKALEAAEVKAEKEERKKTSAAAEAEEKPKAAVKLARTRLERRGKKYREAAKLIDKSKKYSLAEAVALAQKTSSVKYDASVELHINLNVDPKHADQNIRGNLVLPHGTGKTIKIAVFDDAKVDGADLAGVENITKQLENGEMNFDVLISTPANMPKLGKYARLLGPRGLMPNPKSGTVTTDTAKAVAEAKAGKLDYRVDSTGIVHAAVGKVSFSAEQLAANADALLSSVRAAKPASIKSNYIRSLFVTTSGGPSIAVESNA
jgi:large subunit ribosomal protein L1